jgi:hypothetical protein
MINFINAIMYPLQAGNLQNFSFGGSNKDNENAMIYFVAAIGIIVAIIILLNVFKGKGKAGPGGKNTATSSGPRAFSGLTLHRLTSNLGLDRDQVKMLDYVMRSGSINDPERFLNSPELIDKNFKRTYRLIERTSKDDDDLNERLSVLFAVRNIIDINFKGSTATSSRQIPDKVPAMLTIDGVNYPVQVISTKGDTLAVDNPKRAAGSLLHPARGSKATLAFYTKTTKGLLIDTRVMGTAEVNDVPVLQLAHSGQIKRLSARRFRRRQIIIDTGFYFVSTDSKTKKLSVEPKRYAGKILDISIGGCSLKTISTVNSGQRLKVEFLNNNETIIAALGEVLRITKTGVNAAVHIRFTKVPRRSLNSINAMVYEYSED